jgi:hypothetical protein
MSDIKPILVGVDSSAGSRQARCWASHEAELHGARFPALTAER